MLKTTKGSGSFKDASTIVIRDKDLILDEEEMALLAKKFTRFFQNKKFSSSGVRKDNLSKNYLTSMKNNDDYKDE